MHTAAISFYKSSFSNRDDYKSYLINLLKPIINQESCLVVLPGNTGLLLALRWGDLGTPENYREAYKSYLILPSSWHEGLLDLHIETARQLSVYLVCGTGIFIGNHSNRTIISYLISPHGEVLGTQKQLYLSREEKSLGIARGEDLEVFSTPMGNVGIILGSDAFYPEVGRILSLKGADIVCHCGSLSIEEQNIDQPGENAEEIIFWRQIAGMWSQVQQNQFFSVESQLMSTLLDRDFKGNSFILAPCEITAEQSGFLAGIESEKLVGLEGLLRKNILQEVPNGEYPAGVLPASEVVKAYMDFEARNKIMLSYPLLKLLHPLAYGPLAFKEKEQ